VADSLDRYREKRDFRRTAEPKGAEPAEPGGGPRFVVQKHDARRLHYDFRLEAGGVLKSWAVPRGPSPDPANKRLAVRTEDHPLEYADFEGTIPKGEYGGGAVIVWDTGTYRNLTEQRHKAVPVEEAVERGHVTVWLDGHKLHGAYALTRTGGRGRDSWILVKVRDELADSSADPVSDRPESVRSGRTVEQVATEAG
jgi:DNA ligase D-like protein (predicted 3'-phosphoesterase)